MDYGLNQGNQQICMLHTVLACWLTLPFASLSVLLTLLIIVLTHFVTKYIIRNTQETEQTKKNSIKRQLKIFNCMQDSDNWSVTENTYQRKGY